MRKPLVFLAIGAGLLLTGCYQSSTAWEDTKTVGRRLHRKARLIWRKDVDSRMVESADDFTPPTEEEYLPYENDDIKTLKTEFIVPPAQEEPGMQGSQIPSIESFKSPQATLKHIFTTMHFDTDKDSLRHQEQEIALQIAKHMKTHPDLYLFIEGHCDHRGTEKYNLALGTRRASSVRVALVKLGVDPNHIFTVSYGKELPVDVRNTPAAWAKNRRAEFKLFENNPTPLPN